MSYRHEMTFVFALSPEGDSYCIYDREFYAGGCQYKAVVTVEGLQYAVCGYPLEGTGEETGPKLPQLSVEDLRSYFTEAPTEAIRQVLAIATLEDMAIAQLVMVVQQLADGDVYEAQCISVTKEGLTETVYGPDGFAGDDACSQAMNLADDAWQEYRSKAEGL